MNFVTSAQLYALMGGTMIGASAVLLLYSLGKIAGISGILRGLLSLQSSAWRILYLVGIFLGSGIAGIIVSPTAQTQNPMSLTMIILAGLLVGIGSNIGGGCTSGHGVCGLARLSKRSIVATITFLSVAILTTYLTQHVWTMPL